MTPSQTVRLADGRALAYAQGGQPDGRPVLECPRQPGSRVLLWDEDVARRLGVRLITVDRPGIGGSSPLPRRTVASWAGDVAQLLDALELERVALLGYSVGGAYAAACAHALPERVAALALVESIVPLDRPGRLGELGRPLQWQLARRSPRLAGATNSVQAGILRLAPGLAARAYASRLPAPDRAAVERDPALAARAVETALEAIAQSGRGLVDDLRAAMRPWGLRLAEVAVPTMIWQGDRDASIPLAWGRELEQSIPGATLRECAGEGHLLLADRLAEVLADLDR